LQSCAFRFISQRTPKYIDPVNNLNPNPTWCPNAKCHNSLLCQPCQRRFLIVIATGRSGSTTLSSMLDRLPGVRMAGENNGQLQFLRKSIENLATKKEYHLNDGRNVIGPWKHNPIPLGSLSCPVQHMLENMNPPQEEVLFRGGGEGSGGSDSTTTKGYNHNLYHEPRTIYGFKTVRFHAPAAEIEASVRFVLEHIPCSRVIVNIRSNINEQAQSWAKAFHNELDVDSLVEYNHLLESVSASFGQDRARLLDMSEWSSIDNDAKKDISGDNNVEIENDDNDEMDDDDDDDDDDESKFESEDDVESEDESHDANYYDIEEASGDGDTVEKKRDRKNDAKKKDLPKNKDKRKKENKNKNKNKKPDKNKDKKPDQQIKGDDNHGGGEGRGLDVLNDLVNWLGFEECLFPRLLHENKNRYGKDVEAFNLGKNCHLPDF